MNKLSDAPQALHAMHQELGEDELGQVVGGALLLPAVQKVREAAARAPTESVAFNFTKIEF
jgi:hypothetical protein